MSFVWLKNLFSSSSKSRHHGELPTSSTPPPSYSRYAKPIPSHEMPRHEAHVDAQTPLLHHTTHTGHTIPISRPPAPTRGSSLSSHTQYGLGHGHHPSHPHPSHLYTNGSAYDPETLSNSSGRSGNAKRPWWKVDARVISDATIGLSDGLTVPFALTAGLSALGNTKVVIYGGLAELIAGAISMGLGGWLGAKSELASYKATKQQTKELIYASPIEIEAELAEIFAPYSLPPTTLTDLTTHLRASPNLLDFLMRFRECLEEPSPSRALTSALTIAGGYFFGGLLPLLPYFFVGEQSVYEALWISVAVMAVALFVFGYVKTCVVVGWQGRIGEGFKGGGQMVVVGGAAAGAAMGLVWLFNRDT